ncbi:MAG: hypothetical protein OQK67_02020, partial [Chlorobium sp.]|nr:hypothetical protein [Chlorobium sp.]
LQYLYQKNKKKEERNRKTWLIPPAAWSWDKNKLIPMAIFADKLQRQISSYFDTMIPQGRQKESL